MDTVRIHTRSSRRYGCLFLESLRFTGGVGGVTGSGFLDLSAECASPLRNAIRLAKGRGPLLNWQSVSVRGCRWLLTLLESKFVIRCVRLLGKIAAWFLLRVLEIATMGERQGICYTSGNTQ